MRRPRALGLQRVGLLGTGFTMEAGFYPDVFIRNIIDVRVPDAEGRAWLHDRYLGELLNGVFRDETRDGVHQLIEDLRNNQQIEAIILAETELPLLVRAETIDDLPLLDTTELHVRAIVSRLGIAQPERAV